MKDSIKKRFELKGMDIVEKNWACVDNTVAALQEIPVPASLDGVPCVEPAKFINSEDMDDFARAILLPSMKLEGDKIPVSAMSIDGVLPTATARLEKRGVAPLIPKWHGENCIQCNICSMVCPHAAIRPKLISEAQMAGAPASFDAVDVKPKAVPGLKFKMQIFPEDCQGCAVCIQACPMTKMVKRDPETKKVIDDSKAALTVEPLTAARERGENDNVKFFLDTDDNVQQPS